MPQRPAALFRAALPAATALAILLAAPGPAAAESARLEALVPADVDLALLIEDVPGLRAAWPGLPMVRAWNDPQLAEMVGLGGAEGLPAIPGWVDGRDPQHPGSRLLALCSGQAMLVVPDVSAWQGGESQTTGLPPGLVLLADVAGHRQEAEALLSAPAGEDGSDQAAGGLGLPTDMWAIRDDVLIMGASAEDTAAAAAWLGERGTRATLAAGDGYAALTRRGGGDIQLIANLEPLISKLQAALEQESLDDIEESPLGITPGTVVQALGLDALRGAWLGLRLRPDHSEADYGITFSEERGLVRLLALKPLSAGERLPVPESAVDASVMRMDVPAFWQALRDIMAAMSPVLAAGVDAQLAQLSAQAGIDLNTAVPGAFAGRVTIAAFMHPLASPGTTLSPEDLDSIASQIWIADLNPDHRLAEVMAGLSPMLAMTGMQETVVQVDGQSLHLLTPPARGDDGEAEGEPAPAGNAPTPDPDVNVVGWAMSERYLVMGQARPGDFGAVLGQLATGQDGLWQRADVKTLLAGLPDGASGLQFQDSASALAGVFHSLAAVSRSAGAEAPAVDADGLAELMARYITASAGAAYRRPGEFAVTFHVQHGTN